MISLADTGYCIEVGLRLRFDGRFVKVTDGRFPHSVVVVDAHGDYHILCLRAGCKYYIGDRVLIAIQRNTKDNHSS